MKSTGTVRLHQFMTADDGDILCLADIPLPGGGAVALWGLDYDPIHDMLWMTDIWPEPWQAGLLRALRGARKLRVSFKEKTEEWLDANGRPVEILVHPEEPGADLYDHTNPPSTGGEALPTEITVSMEDLDRFARVN